MRNLIKQTNQKISEEISDISSSLPSYVKPLKIKSLFIKFFLVIFLFFSSVSGRGLVTESLGMVQDEVYGDCPVEKEEYVEEVRDKIYESLQMEVESYIKRVAPTSGINSTYLTQKCLEYNMDIVFVLAQGVLESNLGTKGKAAFTNSVWNVGTYDNGEVKYTYSDPNESIIPYMELVTKKYLINITSRGDTIYKDLHLLVRDRGYKNYNGSRFATDVGYENSMRKHIVEINMQTSISFYQDLYELNSEMMLAYFVPSKNLAVF